MARDKAGVRPSSGAATQDSKPGPENGAEIDISWLSAPEDGRTPQ